MVKEQLFETGLYNTIKSSEDIKVFDVIISFKNNKNMEFFFNKLIGKNYKQIMKNFNITKDYMEKNIGQYEECMDLLNSNEKLKPVKLQITNSVAVNLNKCLLFAISEKGEELGIKLIETDKYMEEF